jgi:hypothetical protein
MAVVQGRIEAGTVGRGRGRVSVVCCGRDVREVFKPKDKPTKKTLTSRIEHWTCEDEKKKTIDYYR